MADTEVVFGYLIRGLVGERGTRIDGFDQDAWLAALHYDKRDMKKSFAEYRAFREANVALLKSLTPEGKSLVPSPIRSEPQRHLARFAEFNLTRTPLIGT
jgi:hypothetical protein